MRLDLLLLALVCCCSSFAQEESAGELPLWSACYEAVDWYHRAEVPDTESSLKDLVARGALETHSRQWISDAIAKAPAIDECLARAKEQQKLLFWYIPTVEGQHVILPHLLDRYMTVGLLSDPDVVELLNRRFLSIKLPAGGDLARTYNLKAPGFIEPGFVVLAANGDVLFQMNRINTFNAEYFLDVLQQLVAMNSEHCAPSRAYRDMETELAQENVFAHEVARLAILEGEYERARELLERATEETLGPQAAWVHLSYADLLMRLRDGDGVLEKLELAEELGESWSPVWANVHITRGRLQIARGQFDAAHTTLELAESRFATTGRANEALYWFGALHFNQQQPERARRLWSLAASRVHETASPAERLWAARADAYTRPGSDGGPGEGPLTRSMEYIRWLDEEAYGLRRDTRWRRGIKDVGRIARRGVEFLLSQQRADGSWSGLRWGKGADDSREYHNFEMAISALCCAALRDWHGMAPSRIDKALARGEAYLLRDDLVTRGDAMVWVYADCFRLLHLSRRMKEVEGPQKEVIHEQLKRWVKHVVGHQAENEGALKHYVYASTFVTACAAYCLHEARSNGVSVPDEVFELASGVLERARGADGLYGYLVSNPAVTRTPTGAASRQPLCEWVMFLCGKSSEQKLDKAMRAYFDGYRESTELARKSNFHIPALDNVAGYYFFHNFYPATRAAEMTGRYQRKNMRKLLTLLCELPEIDGTFVDASFSYGKSYGTAMALMSLRVLATRR